MEPVFLKVEQNVTHRKGLLQTNQVKSTQLPLLRDWDVVMLEQEIIS